MINVPFTANAYYWLAYNTNGTSGNSNNLRYDSGGAEAWVTPVSLGTWPGTFGTPSGTGTANLSVYATVQFNTLGHERGHDDVENDYGLALSNGGPGRHDNFDLRIRRFPGFSLPK